MSKEINYLKEAFKRQENIISLLGFSIAAALFNSGFLFLGGMLEAIYLWTVSTNPRFQRVVRAEKNKSQSIFSHNEKEKLAKSLPQASQERYRSLEKTCKRVYDACDGFDIVTRSILQPSIDKLDYLLATFLRTEITLNHICNYLEASDRSQIEREIKLLEQEVNHAQIPQKLKEIKFRNLEILRQRASRLKKLQDDVEIMRAQLTALENAIKFISDQSVSMNDPKEISTQIDNVVSEMQDTEKSIKDVEMFMETQQDMDKKEADKKENILKNQSVAEKRKQK